MPPRISILLQALTGQTRYCMYCDLRAYLSSILEDIQVIDSVTVGFTPEQYVMNWLSHPQLRVSSSLLAKP